ncbi:MAG: preprotein translocase subunit YajC [Acidibacillus sp.]|uniref:Sec translocon accessory complex subunit YajC n=1 Tax=Sulfoacidibacillus ferrooxidans TaxID=2005001 RepID=A0A9X2AD16_9BACL|nr:preprotein translocase subunit YajC [Sulfoacidibacillus ferrooxidans]MCI0182021.1 Sec translocon accessory complex subunit YajC [Sulfoacidibacillus ferrooxidans]MCY0892397.1 preprotein translocase subunit YajC [Acidibacillus sp.]
MSESALMQYLPLILIIVVFYFLLIRPQQKRQRERSSLLQSLQSGDQVVTIGGIHGTITAIDGNIVKLRIAPDLEVTFERKSIDSVRRDV